MIRNQSLQIIKAWFLFSCHINTQNLQMWHDENSNAIQQVPLQNIKVGLCCTLSVK
jgi:hypothetical protein